MRYSATIKEEPEYVEEDQHDRGEESEARGHVLVGSVPVQDVGGLVEQVAQAQGGLKATKRNTGSGLEPIAQGWRRGCQM